MPRLASVAFAVVLASLPTLAGGLEGVRLNLGAGASMTRFGGAVDSLRGWVPGLELDLYAAVPGSVVREKLPRRYRKAVARDGEIGVRPWFLAILPRRVRIGPDDSLSVYGATWELLGVGSGLKLSRTLSLDLDAKLPTLDWNLWDGPTLRDGTQNTFSLGTSARAGLDWKPSPWFRMSAGWTHTAAWTFQELRLADGSRDRPWEWGAAQVIAAVRLPLKL